jgi:hypothetical protein
LAQARLEFVILLPWPPGITARITGLHHHLVPFAT